MVAGVHHLAGVAFLRFLDSSVWIFGFDEVFEVSDCVNWPEENCQGSGSESMRNESGTLSQCSIHTHFLDIWVSFLGRISFMMIPLKWFFCIVGSQQHMTDKIRIVVVETKAIIFRKSLQVCLRCLNAWCTKVGSNLFWWVLIWFLLVETQNVQIRQNVTFVGEWRNLSAVKIMCFWDC